jgi:hypothetical protein
MKEVDNQKGTQGLEFYQELIKRIAEFAETDFHEGEQVLFTQNLNEILRGLKVDLNHKYKLVELGFLKIKEKDPESFFIIIEPTPNRELGEIARNIRDKMTEMEHICGFKAAFTGNLTDILKTASADPQVLTKLIAEGYVIIRAVRVNTGQPTSWYVCRTLDESKKLRAALARQTAETK